MALFRVHFAATHDERLPALGSLTQFEAADPQAAVVAAFQSGMQVPPGQFVFAKVVVEVHSDGTVITQTLRCPTGYIADLN